MTNKMKSAFDKIHAEDQLKETTINRIFNQDANQVRTKPKPKTRKIAAAFACAIPLVVIGFFSFNMYYTETAYVDLDINPSVELSINRFDRIIDATAYNKDGERLLEEINIKNKKIDSALPLIINATAEEGQLQKEALVSVTVQTDSDKEKSLLDHVKSIVNNAISSYDNIGADVFSVDNEIKTASHEEHLTPAKYLAILDLQKVDETATFNECRHHSISNIKKQTAKHEQEHKRGKNGSGNNHNSGENNSGDNPNSKKSGSNRNHNSENNDSENSHNSKKNSSGGSYNSENEHEKEPKGKHGGNTEH